MIIISSQSMLLVSLAIFVPPEFLKCARPHSKNLVTLLKMQFFQTNPVVNYLRSYPMKHLHCLIMNTPSFLPPVVLSRIPQIFFHSTTKGPVQRYSANKFIWGGLARTSASVRYNILFCLHFTTDKRRKLNRQISWIGKACQELRSVAKLTLVITRD